jgi:hypothetical protein
MSEELARRAVACKAWKWMPGMLSNWGRVLWAEESGHAFIWEQAVTLGPMPKDAVPNLVDRATLGCLLHLVREHWGDDGACLRRGFRSNGSERWTCEWMCHAPSVRYPLLQTIGATEAEALVKALEFEVNDD